MRTFALLPAALGLFAGCRAAVPPADAELALQACRHAKELSDREEYDAALVEIRRAIELDPRNAWAHYHQGWMLSETGGCERALPSYGRAIELLAQDAPSDSLRWKALLNRGWCELQLGRHAPAIADLSQVIEHTRERRWLRMAFDFRAQSEFALGLQEQGRRDQDEAARLGAEADGREP